MNYTTAKLDLSYLFHYKTLVTSLHLLSPAILPMVSSQIRLYDLDIYIYICICDSLNGVEVEVEVNLRPTASRPVCLGVRLPWPDFYFLFDNCGFRDVWHPLWREDGSVNYCTIVSVHFQSSHSWVEVPQNSRPYFTVSFETPPTWSARSLYLYPPGTGWPSYTPGHKMTGG
jgi:hypothetical protein